ncbi:MAG: hypothetical protein CMJ83_13095, partial [Planctomycetes bacterium]|nr:hypothetical protein [Planctomycetota bacterium]
RQYVREVTGEKKFHESDPVLIFLQWFFEPDVARYGRWIRLPEADIAETIGYELSGKESTFVSWEELRANDLFKNKLQSLYDKKPEARNEADKELLGLSGRFNIIAVVAGLPVEAKRPRYLPIIPPVDAPEPEVEYEWYRPDNMARTGWPQEKRQELDRILGNWADAWSDDDRAAFTRSSEALVGFVASLEPGKDERFRGMDMIDREVRLNLINPFSHSRWNYFLAICIGLLCLPFMSRVRYLWILPVLTLAAALGFHAWGVFERTAISERAMIGTFYESMIFVAGACAFFGIAFDCWLRRGFFVVGGGFLACVSMFVAVGNPDFMDPEISKLLPVLINNDLIHIHVPTIMASYAALGLSFLLGQVYLLLYFFMSEKRELMKLLLTYMFWIIPVGVILLFAGIILGGVWADASWGRFWGWDPKETASLVTWLVYMIVVHGRWSGWLRDYGTAIGSIFGGLALLWTYYGANYFLVGRHSYAGAGVETEIPTWLKIFLACEVALVVGTALVWSARRAAAAARKSG